MKLQHDYTNIDAAICARLKSGPNTFTQLQYGDVQKEAKKLEHEDTKKRGSWPTSAFRFIDRRLQALRKSGKITYSTKSGWSLVDNGGEA